MVVDTLWTVASSNSMRLRRGPKAVTSVWPPGNNGKAVIMQDHGDLYEILQLHPSAEPDIIQAARRRLTLRYHPDRNSSPEAAEVMLRVNYAYEILSDPEQRAAYDLNRTGLMRGNSPSIPVRTPPRKSREMRVRLDKKVSLIQRIGLFNDVEPAELMPIAQQMTEKTYQDGEVVFFEGEPGDRLYLIAEGNMHVYVEREGSIITYDRLQPGECFGEMALVEDAPRSATVRSEGPSLCHTLSKEEFLDLLDRNPNIALGMLKSLAGRLRRNNVQIQEYAQRLADPSNGEVKVNGPGSGLESIFGEMFRVFGTRT